MNNPFFNRGPIREAQFYFARPRETREVVRLLAGAQNCSLVGPIRSGKTSLLWRVRDDLEQGTVVYLSFEGLLNLSPEQFFHRLALETVRQARKAAIVWPGLEGREELGFLELQDFLEQAEGLGEPMIFCLDEVELAAANPAFDVNLFSALRSIAARPGVCFVTATERGLHELEAAAGRKIGSPFSDLFSVVKLRSLDRETAWREVDRLASEAGYDLSSEQDLILELGGGWPYYLQVVAYEVCELKERRGQATSEGHGRSQSPCDRPLRDEERRFVRSRSYEQVEPVLTLLWERLTVNERASALASLPGEAGPAVEGLTMLADGGVQPVSGLAQRFLEERSRDQTAPLADLAAADPLPQDRTMALALVRALVRAMEARDQYFRGHGERVARLAAAMAAELGGPQELTEALTVAGRVLEIGRVSVSDLILLKPGALTEKEMEIVRALPLVSAQILDALEFPWPVRPAVRYHHERLDGSGYPEALVSDEIPLAARLLAVAEVMVAMTSDRPHRKARSVQEALQELEQGAGVKYDREAVEAVRRMAGRGEV